MSAPIGVLQEDHDTRPALHRSRSHSSPSQNGAPTDPAAEPLRTSRPQPVRAHSLLPPGAVLTPEDPKASSSQLEKVERLASDKLHRNHLPGKHHHSRGVSQDNPPQDPPSDSRRRSKLHRYTQSLAEQHHYTNSHAYHNAGAAMHSSQVRSRRAHGRDEAAGSEGLPNLVAGLNAERNRAQPRPGATKKTTTANSLNVAHPTAPGLSRVPTSHSYRGLAAGDAAHLGHGYSSYYEGRPTDALRRRATSDPRSASYDPQSLGTAARPKTQVELDLERAERLKRQRKFTLTTADLSARDKEIAAAEDELREKLQEISHQGMEITRRLDYGYYNLLEKVGNLGSVIQSFQSLSTQSGHIISNLESEVAKTDEHVRSKAEHLKSSFDHRGERVRALEERGKDAQRKAEDLGQRLERARGAVEKWEEHEMERQKVWGRFLARMWGSMGCLLVLIVALLVAKEVWLGAPTASQGLLVPVDGGREAGGGGGFLGLNRTLAAGGGTNSRMEAVMKRVPDDVRSVLVEIEERNREGDRPAAGVEDVTTVAGETTEEPDALRALDEL